MAVTFEVMASFSFGYNLFIYYSCDDADSMQTWQSDHCHNQAFLQIIVDYIHRQMFYYVFIESIASTFTLIVGDILVSGSLLH